MVKAKKLVKKLAKNNFYLILLIYNLKTLNPNYSELFKNIITNNISIAMIKCIEETILDEAQETKFEREFLRRYHLITREELIDEMLLNKLSRPMDFDS